MESHFERVVALVPIRTGLGLATTVRLLNPVALISNLWRSRQLIMLLARRDIVTRYRGSYLGVLWSFITPIFMLTIFTLVFGVIFNARWGLENEGRLDFALVLLCGLFVFNIFSEFIARAPTLVLSQPQYVKKIRFPLEILPVTVLISVATHAAVSLLVLVLALLLFRGTLHWTLVLFPLVILPLLLLCLGLGWFLSSVGVFFRDVNHVIGLATMAALFLSPVFYPVSLIPDWLQTFYRLNPLTLIIENTRAIVIWGNLPNWTHLTVALSIGLMLALLGYAWFQRTRNGFADVL